MALFRCRCGHTFSQVPESGGRWYTAEDHELLLSGIRADIREAFFRARSIYTCPNCAALAVEDEGDRGRYRFYVLDPSHVRVFVDRSQTDALGGYSLQHSRTQRDLAEQKVIVKPGLTITAYDDTGWSAPCSIEQWLNPDDTYDEDRWVARYPDRSQR